jgi:hypothetical protein
MNLQGPRRVPRDRFFSGGCSGVFVTSRGRSIAKVSGMAPPPANEPVYVRWHRCPHCRTGQCESIFAIILSAKAIASEIAHSDAAPFAVSGTRGYEGGDARRTSRISGWATNLGPCPSCIRTCSRSWSFDLRKARKGALDSTFLLILLQTAPKDLCYQTFRSICKRL